MTRDEIEQTITEARAHIKAIGEAAAARAWLVEQTGLVLGEGNDRLYTNPMGFEAPKEHPVWADELRYELGKLREMGEAGTVERREYELDYVKWPRADVLERFGERVGEHSALERTQELAWDRLQVERAHREPSATELGRFRAARETLTPEEILRDAIETGYEEGYPLRPEQIASIQRRLGLEPTGRDVNRIQEPARKAERGYSR